MASLFTARSPFEESSLGLDLTDQVYMEIASNSKLYELLKGYIVTHTVNGLRSTRAEPTSGKKKKSECGGGGCHESACNGSGVGDSRVALELGLGLFQFRDQAGNVITALHQQRGKPVGSNCGVTFFTNLILFAESADGKGNERLTTFLSILVEESERSKAGCFKVYSWHCKYHYWSSKGTVKARPLSSVILPAATIGRLVDDVSTFLSPETQAFYEDHGIPYKRSYLFYGTPGAGKTSLIQALAGHFKRSVSYLQPSHPEMTDDSLKDSINELPSDTIVVLEDIDSLFDKDRSSKIKSSLTFSGLLNAIDGVGSANGHIFILTTNLRDQLDPALIRSGRVDCHVEFAPVVREQLERMWASFYPAQDGGADLAAEFAERVLTLLGDRALAAAGLQHYFVRNMNNSAEVALGNVQWIIDDLNEKDTEAAKAKEAKAAADKVKGGKKKKTTTPKQPAAAAAGSVVESSTSSASSNGGDDASAVAEDAKTDGDADSIASGVAEGKDKDKLAEAAPVSLLKCTGGHVISLAGLLGNKSDISGQQQVPQQQQNTLVVRVEGTATAVHLHFHNNEQQSKPAPAPSAEENNEEEDGEDDDGEEEEEE